MNRVRWIVAMTLISAFAVIAEEGTGCGAAAATEPARIVAGGEVSQLVSLTAEVVKIKAGKREVTLQLPDGSKKKVVVGKEAYNFDQIKVGDRVNIDLAESVALFVDTLPTDPGASSAAVLARAPKGQKPEGVMVSYEDATATVTDIDYQKRSISLLGPDGDTLSMNVPADAAPNFDKIKKGDTVVVRYTATLALKVESADAKKE